MRKKYQLLMYPYLVWSILFILLPLLIILYFSVTKYDRSSGEFLGFSFEGYKEFFRPINLRILWKSMELALISTFFCLFLGYPVAMILNSIPGNKKRTLIMLIVLPMWLNLLLKTYAWTPILGRTGLINNFFDIFGVGPFKLMNTNGAVILGMVYNFIPFMILPILTILQKIDRALIEAAYDLGADKRTAFTRIILPLSIPGVISGISMVFMPSVSTFIISELLGGNQFMLIGNYIQNQYLLAYNWNLGSSVSIILMLIILFSMSIMTRIDRKGVEEVHNLW